MSTETATHGTQIAYALEALTMLDRSRDRVRLGWTLSNGRGDHPVETYTAEDAAAAVAAVASTAELCGLTVQSMTVERVDELDTPPQASKAEVEAREVAVDIPDVTTVEPGTAPRRPAVDAELTVGTQVYRSRAGRKLSTIRRIDTRLADANDPASGHLVYTFAPGGTSHPAGQLHVDVTRGDLAVKSPGLPARRVVAVLPTSDGPRVILERGGKMWGPYPANSYTYSHPSTATPPDPIDEAEAEARVLAATDRHCP